MAQATEIKKNWIDFELLEIDSLIVPEVEEKSIETEIKKGKQAKLKKFSRMLSKIANKSKHNANYMKERIPIQKIKNTAYRTYAVY